MIKRLNIVLMAILLFSLSGCGSVVSVDKQELTKLINQRYIQNKSYWYYAGTINDKDYFIHKYQWKPGFFKLDEYCIDKGQLGVKEIDYSSNPIDWIELKWNSCTGPVLTDPSKKQPPP